MMKADLVATNANIITVDRKLPRAQALAVWGDTFASVGKNDEIESLIGKDTEVLDLKGKTVLPGLIDAHIHVLSSGISHVTTVDCGLGSIAEIKAALKERVLITRSGEWVRGFKYDDMKTSEGRGINRKDLDEVSIIHPIFLAHRGGHTFYLNSKAMEVAGIREGSVAPTGGKYDTDPDTGKLNGVIHERAANHITQDLLPGIDRAKRLEGLKFISRMFNSSGLTSVHDAMVGNENLSVYQGCLENGELSLRVYALIGFDSFKCLSACGIKTGFGDPMLRIGGIKLVADGAIAGRTAYLSRPYEGSTDDRGILAMEPEELEEKVSAVHEAGFQSCVHANGDSAIEMVLSAYEKALKSSPRENCRHRIEHGTVITPSILERLKRLGCVVTPFCTYIYYHGDKMKFYGEERVSMMFAHRSFLDKGIISTGATDYSPGPYQPLLSIQSMATRTDMDGNVWGANQRVSVEEAIRIYTLHGAYASFEEDIKGSIEVGKLADFVVLGDDPTRVDPGEIKDIPVERTIVGGKTVFQL
ncbi:amidohydrolase [Candidatus Poribacteria bacterium]